MYTLQYHNPIIRSKAEQIQKYMLQEALINRLVIKMTVKDRENMVTDPFAGRISTICE
jgi:hypothetical protein